MDLKENQRIALTKKMLKEALLKLLKKKTVDKVTVTELCKEANINRATFYRHYSVPTDILIEIEAKLTENSREILSLNSDKPSDEFVIRLCQYLYDNADIIRILIKNKSDEYLSRMIKEAYNTLINIKDEANELKNLDEESLMLISSYVAGGGYYMLRRWITEGMKKSPEEMAALIMLFVNKLI